MSLKNFSHPSPQGERSLLHVLCRLQNQSSPCRHVTIRTLLLRFFEAGLKSSNNEQLFVASLRTSANGQTPHRGAAIGLVFERLIEEGRKTLFPSVKPKPSSTLEPVEIVTTSANTATTTTKSPLDTGSSNDGYSGSETTDLSSVKELSKPKQSYRKKLILSKFPHLAPCGCGICKRAGKALK